MFYPYLKLLNFETHPFYGIVENGVLYSFVVYNSLIISVIVLFIIFYLT